MPSGPASSSSCTQPKAAAAYQVAVGAKPAGIPLYFRRFIIMIRTEDNRPFGLASRKRCWRVLPCWMRSAEDLANIS
jgi:hypothetical protein